MSRPGAWRRRLASSASGAGRSTSRPPEPAGGAAQRRADRIRAFQAELAETEAALGPLIEGEGRARLEAHHAALLEGLRQSFDVDATEAERQLSLGMRVASFLGAVALSAAVFLFFYRYWGQLGTSTQVGLLTLGPVLGLVLTGYAARRERTLYFATLAALVASAAFVLALAALHRIYNIPESPFTFLAWGVFGLALAGAYGFRLVMAGAVVALTVFVLGVVTSLSGAWWSGFMGRPEGLVLAGAAWLVVPARREDLEETVRVSGAAMAFLGLMALGLNGELSLLPLSRGLVEGLYDVVGLGAAAGGIWLGIRRRWEPVRILSMGFLVVMLLVKAFDWWWDWMPRELFFLLLGLVAVGTLAVLRRLRRRLA